MAGLREQKKKEAYQRILDAGKAVFNEQGYEKTTMEQLAVKAGIGVGTLYNYFETKADIFLSIMDEDLSIHDFTFHPDKAALQKGAADIVWQFIDRYFGLIKTIPKRFLKEVFFAIMSSMKSNSRFLKRLKAIDFQYIDKLNALLETLKEKGLLTVGFDSESAAMIIYSIIMTQTMLYAVSKDISCDQLKDAVHTQIAFILQGKSTGNGEVG